MAIDLDPTISHLNVSPRGTGDFSLDDTVTLQRNVRQEEIFVQDEDGLNLIIDFSSQLNSENVEFSKSKPIKLTAKANSKNK